MTRRKLSNIIWIWSLSILFAVFVTIGVMNSREEEREEELNEWVTLQMAIILTESQFDSTAFNPSGAKGLYQLMPIYVKEVNNILDRTKDKREKFKPEDAYDIDKSIEMFNILQDYFNPEKDIDKAISYHNKGRSYKKKVYKNMEHIRNVEEIRRKILKSQE